MSDIRIKVGIAVDANAAAVLAPIDRAVKRTRKTIESEMAAASRAAVRETQKGVTSQEASWRKLEAEVEREANKILRTQERADRQAVASANKAEKEKTAAVKRESRARAAAERAAAREVDKARRAEAKAIPWYAKNIVGHGGYGGAIGIGRRAGIRVSRGAAMAYGYGGAALSGMAGIGRDVLSGLGVDTSLSSMIGKSQEQQALATKVSNAGYIPGQTQLVGGTEVLSHARAVANQTGTDTGEALEALQKFVGKTGDLKLGMDMLGQMATLSRATGTHLDDMADAAAEVSNHLGDMPDKGKVTEQIMKQIAGQGKLGAVEIRDMAHQMAKIAASANQFKGGAAANIAILGVLGQESKLRGGSASASQAATAVTAFSQGFSVKSTLKAWKSRGLTPYTDSSQSELSDPKSIIEGALKYASSKTKNGLVDQAVLKQLFPSKMGYRAVAGFEDIYNKAGGGNKGIEAVNEEFARLSKAQLDNEEVQRAFGESMKTSEAQVKIFNNKMTEVAEQLAGAIIPALEDLAPSVVNFSSSIANMIGNLTGGNRDRALTDADSLNGKEDKDEQLLLGNPTYEGRKRVYSAEELEVLKHHGAQRAKAMGELSTQVDEEKEQVAGYETPITDPMSGAVMGTGAAPKELSTKLENDQKVLEAMQRDQAQLLIVMQNVHQAIRDGNAIARSAAAPPPPKPAPGASPNADVSKDDGD